MKRVIATLLLVCSSVPFASATEPEAFITVDGRDHKEILVEPLESGQLKYYKDTNGDGYADTVGIGYFEERGDSKVVMLSNIELPIKKRQQQTLEQRKRTINR